MNIAMTFGQYSAELADDGALNNLRVSYQAALEQTGAVFPDPELQKLSRQHQAAIAQGRGEYYLEADGSQVDLSDFDLQSAAQRLQENEETLANAERLQSLIDLTLISRAGALATSRVSRIHGADSASASDFRRLTNQHKHFVQVGMAVSEWPDAWRAIVAKNFAGSSLHFPLDAAGIRYAIHVFYEEAFKELRGVHFGNVALLGHHISNGMDITTLASAEPQQVRLAAVIGLFYRNSPQGCHEMIDELVERGRLHGGIDWPGQLRESSEYAWRNIKP